MNRRAILKTLAATGIGTAVFQRSVAAAVIQEKEDFSIESIKESEWITELELTDEQREEILNSVKRTSDTLREFRKTKIDYSVPMSIHFGPTNDQPRMDSVTRDAQTIESLVIQTPSSNDEIAHLPVHQLSWLVRTQKITSQFLTKLYLERLKKYGNMLHCVVTVTEELALKQAKQADEEIAKGLYRGPLHGIPWGAKDLIAVEGYPTTWGIPHHKDRELDHTATVAKRLEKAGAVLVAKLSLGALAMGDKWFGGMTRNPWNPSQGSSGSSAGSACAVVAGLVGFTLGSETMGSILSPSIRCGASSLRPTFGRVSRDGCMPLSWSMDKIGPICRSIEDCALVFDAIHGADGKDDTANNYPFNWPPQTSTGSLRIGYRTSRRTKNEDREDLKRLKEMGHELVEVKLPDAAPISAMFNIINIEAASVFDDLMRDGHTEGFNSWDESFRAAQYISAVDYVRMQRARTVMRKEFEEATKDVDLLVNMRDLLYTNFTGHPAVTMPVGYKDVKNGGKSPQPVVFSGKLNQDEKLLAFARSYQQQLTAHLERPDLDQWLDARIA